MKWTYPILVLLSFVLLAGCTEKVSEKAEIVQATGEGELVSEEGRTVDVQIELPVITVTDCGDMECFEEKFTACEPATLTLSLSSKLQYYYEILGPENDRCQVRSAFLANPNPAFVGPTMTCLYDNTKSFNDAAGEIIMSFNTDQHKGNCEGDLYELMTSLP